MSALAAGLSFLARTRQDDSLSSQERKGGHERGHKSWERGRERGRPLRRPVKRQNITGLNFFLVEFLLPAEISSQAAFDPDISVVDSGAASPPCSLGAGDPFSHPSGSSARAAQSNSSCSLGTTAHRRGSRAHPAWAGPENVQFRAVFIQFQRTIALGPLWARSNPLLTRGTVESPSKILV